jgi:hypothetical protein
MTRPTPTELTLMSPASVCAEAVRAREEIRHTIYMSDESAVKARLDGVLDVLYELELRERARFRITAGIDATVRG